MIEQSTAAKSKTSSFSHKFTPVCALRKLAGFAEFAQICGTTPTRNRDGDTSYFGTDILGSVRSVTDRNGQVKASYEYDAFGTPYLSNDFDSGAGFGYCGKPYDVGTGLYDYGFRDYAPNSARFTTVDPVRDGANWFSYVVNDPVNYIDPFGLTPYDVPNQTYLGDKDGKSYFRVDEGGTKWGLANATGTPLNEVNGYDGVAESMPIGTILSIPSQINNSGTTPSNSNNAINTSPAITAQSFSQSSNFASSSNINGVAGIKNSGVTKITEEDMNDINWIAEQNGFRTAQLQIILNGQNEACTNLGKIIDRLKRDDNGGLVELAKDYLNIDLNNSSDKEMLLKALGQIQSGLSSKNPGNFKAGKGGDHYAYVNQNGIGTRWLDGKFGVATFENNIYINSSALIRPAYGMDEILIHEQAHISLYAEDPYYESKGYNLAIISNDKKLINADNWRKFYREASK